MTFDQFWKALQQRNPGLADDARMRITVESFRKSMQQAFEMGEQGNSSSRPRSICNAMKDIFGNDLLDSP